MTLRLLLGVVLLALLAFGAVKARPLVLGPHLTLTSPEEGAFLPDGLVLISGSASKESQLSVNGKEGYPDAEGGFSERLLLPSGTSILSVTARDRFGEIATEYRTVVVP